MTGSQNVCYKYHYKCLEKMFKMINNLLQLNLRSNIRRLKLQDGVRNISSNNVNPVLVNLSACNHIFNHNQIRLKYTQKRKNTQKTEVGLYDL